MERGANKQEVLAVRWLIPLMLISVIFLYVPSTARGETSQLAWTRQFGAGVYDSASSVVVDAAGVYVGGITQGTFVANQVPSGFGSAFIRKLDSGGQIVWTNTLETEESVYSHTALALDSPGLSNTSGVYMAGTTSIALPGQRQVGGMDAFIRKYDTLGRHLWTCQFGSTNSDVAVAVAVDATGAYVAGYTWGNMPGPNSGASDAFLWKYGLDDNGFCVPLLRLQFGSGLTDEARAIAVDASGIYVAGFSIGDLPDQVVQGGPGAYVRKYDLQGGHQWTCQFGTGLYVDSYGSHSDEASAIAISASGVYVAGRTLGDLAGSSAGGIDAFVRKFRLDDNGACAPLLSLQFGTNSGDAAQGIAVDSSGFYVAGFVGGELSFQSFAGVRDAFIRSYNDLGVERWTRLFGSSNRDEAAGVALDSTGVYAAGTTLGMLPSQKVWGGADAFARRYDSNGAEDWTSQFGTVVDDVALDIALADSVLYVVGGSEGDLKSASGSGMNKYDYVRTYDLDGNRGWDFTQTGFADESAYAAVATDASNAYVVGTQTPGRCNSPADFWLDVFDANGPTSLSLGCILGLDATAWDVAVDSSGIFVVGRSGHDAALWMYSLDLHPNLLFEQPIESPADDVAYAVAVDSSGVYVAGSTLGELYGERSSGGMDAFLQHYDLNGNLKWTRQFGSPSTDEAFGLAVDDTGIYVGGATWGTLLGQQTVGGRDAFIRKYDVSGVPLWTHQFGSPDNDAAFAVETDRASRVWAAGWTRGTISGQVSAGGIDSFVWSFTQNGDTPQVFQFGTPGDDALFGIATDASGIYVSGTTTGELAGQTSMGGQDAFVAKLTPAPVLRLDLSLFIIQLIIGVLPPAFKYGWKPICERYPRLCPEPTPPWLRQFREWATFGGAFVMVASSLSLFFFGRGDPQAIASTTALYGIGLGVAYSGVSLFFASMPGLRGGR